MIRYSIIRPLKEYDEFLWNTLTSTFKIDNIEECEVIFAAEEECTATDMAQMISSNFPNIPSKIIINSKIHCENPKLSNLIKGWNVAEGHWILMVDSNIFLPFDTLHRLFKVWNPYVGIICSPPLGTEPESFWAEVECAYLNTFQAKWQRIVDYFNFGFVQGKVMVVCKQQFEKLGGLTALASEPCEDASATKMVRRAGLKVRLASKLFSQPLGERSLQQVWNRQIRWAQLRRVTFPLWYSLEIFLSAMPNLLLFILFPHSFLIILLFWASSYIGETLLAYSFGWHRSLIQPLAMLVRDFMMIGVWIRGWFGTSWNWNGKTIRLKGK